MGQALYRKYRSKRLSEIIGQEHITHTLEQALKSGKISHAYLFTGPRGVGKTSIARILAHEVNELPYEDDASHIDIIEIDAASNRRIDEIRDLRDKVHIAPALARYKVYIIDEVHMLTREAFNALLKTLEEPPAHAIFILATTDAHKLPETIISRTQRYTFRPVPAGKVMAHLRYIAKQEKIDISDEALELLAQHGEGSFRDSISLLDQASGQDRPVSGEDIRLLLGIPPAEGIQQLLVSLEQGDPATLVQQLGNLYDQGFQAAGIAKQLGQQLRQIVLGGNSRLEPAAALLLLGQLLEVPVAYDPNRYLEIILLGLPASLSGNASAGAKPQAASVPPPAGVDQKTVKPARRPSGAPRPAEPAPEQPPAEPSAPPLKDTEKKIPQAVLDAALWPQVLSALKQKYNTLYGVVRMAQPSFATPGTVELTFAFAFHQKRISDSKNRQILADIIHNLCGQNVRIECRLDKDLGKTEPAAAPASTSPADLSAISNIFGGGELLES